MAAKLLIAVRRAFGEFLLVPTLVMVGFLLLWIVTFVLDRSDYAALGPVKHFLKLYVLSDLDATRHLLSTIAGGLITITSITISLLLIALQQSASALTHQVYDQFLRNWQNQVYFGVFIGLALYALVTLASVGPLNPTIGASAALLLTVAALTLLLVLFYTTVDQMRPVVIIEAIHGHTLAARAAQTALLKRTRKSPTFDTTNRHPVTATAHGFVTGFDVDRLCSAARAAAGNVEIVLCTTIGAYVVYGQALAEVRAERREDAAAVSNLIEEAITCEPKRDLGTDPLAGIEELETIAWTSISTAQSDPDAGVLTIYALRDILARWGDEAARRSTESAVVYEDDVMPRLVGSLESLAVVASESMQHQSYAEVLRTFDLTFDHLHPDIQARVEDVILRTLSGMGDHILTTDLDSALQSLATTLQRANRPATAQAISSARDRLARSIGKLGARGTRAIR